VTRALIAAALLGAACAGTLPPDAPREAVARAACQDWIGRHNLAERPRRGTRDWDRLVQLCVARHMGAAGQIDRELASR
jgi:hypothetical protein